MPLKFRKFLVADERYEAAGVFDVNGDGVLDIVSGAYWYEGPHFRTVHRIGDVPAEGEYFDDFANIPLDVNGDGRTDYITGGWWGSTLMWRENPGDSEKEWPLHDIDRCGSIERPCAWDIDGDGKLEIVPNCPSEPLSIYKLDTGTDGRGSGSFSKTTVYEKAQGHGLGCGDITGNGRMDLIIRNGWLEAPDDPYNGNWQFQGEFELFTGASTPILVADVNGDGLNDIIVGGGHEYGLDWWEQVQETGRPRWAKHAIDPYNSQYHDLHWLDIDGDGAPELVTGKRYRAHCGRDPGSRDNVGIYYFKWTGEAFSKQVIDFGSPRQATGLGIYSAVVDHTGNGLPDIVAPGKDGLYIFYNEGTLS